MNFIVHFIYGIIIPTDFHSVIFQGGRLNHQPVTEVRSGSGVWESHGSPISSSWKRKISGSKRSLIYEKKGVVQISTMGIQFT